MLNWLDVVVVALGGGVCGCIAVGVGLPLAIAALTSSQFAALFSSVTLNRCWCLLSSLHPPSAPPSRPAAHCFDYFLFCTNCMQIVEVFPWPRLLGSRILPPETVNISQLKPQYWLFHLGQMKQAFKLWSWLRESLHFYTFDPAKKSFVLLRLNSGIRAVRCLLFSITNRYLFFKFWNMECWSGIYIFIFLR